MPDLSHSDVIAPVLQVFDTGRAIEGREVVGMTAAKPGAERSWIVDWYPLKLGGEVAAVGINVRDVTDQMLMERDLRRVMRELQHRVKNMLSNVSALVNRAKRDIGGAHTPEQVIETLTHRLTALSKTHSLLTAENWRSTRLIDIFHNELTEVYGDAIVKRRGPDIRLNARGTLGIGMILHELATNAAKYGSLSSDDGRLSVRWSRIDDGEGEKLKLVWEETGGPEVTAPEGTGFGTKLIKSMAVGNLSGNAEFDWSGDGLVCEIEADWTTVTTLDDTQDEQLF